MLFPASSCSRLIVKIGSALLVDPDGAVRRDWLAGIAVDVAARAQQGQQIAIVSSGAIALGAKRLDLPKGGRASLEDAQAAAATGQILLSQIWAEVLGEQGLKAAQILVTLDDLEQRRRYLNAAATLSRLLKLGVVPIINENDSVATEEIRFGDNDRLAARIAQAAGADAVLLLSDIDGLYDRNPAEAGAVHIASVKRIDAEIEAMADGRSASGMGSGGMISKIAAAKIANASGAHLAIASGKQPRPLSSDGRHTLFLAKKGASARKIWLAGRLTVRGSVTIDEGAERALRKGASLLSAGVIHASGQFERGDVVDVRDVAGCLIARGMSEYTADELQKIQGRGRDELEERLGYAPRSAVIHRDHMVIL